MAQYRDDHGRHLEDYPRPSVAVDTAVLTLDADGRLCVILAVAESGPRLPGTFLHLGETLAEAVKRSLAEKAGVAGLEPAQLHVFDDPARDDRGWVLSVAHLDTASPDRLHLDPRVAQLHPIDDLPDLPFDHGDVIAHAVAELRTEYRDRPDPRRFLPQPFTIRRLRGIHESVAGHVLPPDTFRRAMLPLLTETGRRNEGVVGKPARLFTTREER